MVSFPDNPAFDNARTFERPPDEHPYWANRIFLMQEYGFSREFLVTLAEVDQAQNGRLASRIRDAVKYVKKRCTPIEYETDEDEEVSEFGGRIETLAYEPEYIANALLRPLGKFSAGSDKELNNAENLLQYLIETDELTYHDLLRFETTLLQAYHPDNRMIMVFKPGVREDGTIIDAAGPASQHPGFVDERGKLLDLAFVSHLPSDIFSG